MRRSIALLLVTACGSTAIVEVPVEDGSAGAPSAATPFAGAPSSAGSTSSAPGGATQLAAGGVGSGGAPVASTGTAGASGAAQGAAGAAGMAGAAGVEGTAGSAGSAAPDRSMPYYEPPPGYCAVFRGQRMVIIEWFPRGGWQLSATEYECYSSGNPVRAFGALSRSDEPADGTWASGATICKKCLCEADGTWWQGIETEE